MVNQKKKDKYGYMLFNLKRKPTKKSNSLLTETLSCHLEQVYTEKQVAHLN